jgi:hypothetical protein
VPRRFALALALALACAVAALTATTAAADKRFSGETQQDRRIWLTVGDDGVLRTLAVYWRTRRCRFGGAFMQDRTVFRPPFDAASPDAFSDAGTYTRRQRGGVRIRITIAVRGRCVATPGEAWQGTVQANAIVRRRGRTIDRCGLRSIGWTATRRG